MSPEDLRDVTRLAFLAGNLLTERRNLIKEIAELPHTSDTISWCQVMSLMLKAEGEFYDVDGSLKAGLRSLDC